MNEIVIFEGDNQQVEVRLEGETIWLTQRQMGDLFATTSENVLMHLKNIFQDNELEEAATAKDFLVIRQNVGWVRCAITSYLPLIESVGAHRNPTAELEIYVKCWVTVHACL